MSKRILILAVLLVGCHAAPRGFVGGKLPRNPRARFTREDIIRLVFECGQYEEPGCMADSKNRACFDKGYKQRSLEVKRIIDENAKLKDLLVDWYFKSNPKK